MARPDGLDDEMFAQMIADLEAFVAELRRQLQVRDQELSRMRMRVAMLEAKVHFPHLPAAAKSKCDARHRVRHLSRRQQAKTRPMVTRACVATAGHTPRGGDQQPPGATRIPIGYYSGSQWVTMSHIVSCWRHHRLP